MKKIERVTCYIAVENNGESVAAIKGGNTWFPLVVSDNATAQERIENIAREMKRRNGITIKKVIFKRESEELL